MKKTIYILIGALLIMTVVTCNSKSTSKDKGAVTTDYDRIKYDFELLSAIQSIGKDSLDKNKLWSNLRTTEIDTDNFVETWGGLTSDITVRKSNDSIYIKYSQPSVDKDNNVALQGYAYEITVSNNNYSFIDNSWSDNIETGIENKIEYSPFFLQKTSYSVGDTLRGCLTIKTTQIKKDKIVLTKYLKVAINSVVTK